MNVGVEMCLNSKLTRKSYPCKIAGEKTETAEEGHFILEHYPNENAPAALQSKC